MLYSQSENMKKEYCCSVVQIGSLVPVEGSDFLCVTQINGIPLIVRKDQVQEGQTMFYAANECQLIGEFCEKNNLYDDPEYNTDHTKRGYFNKYGRVRMIKLRGQISMGYLFGLEEMQTFCKDAFMPEVGTEFDMVGNKLFVRAFVPPKRPNMTPKGNRRNKKLKKFDRLVPGEFSFHYETEQLGRNMNRLNPDDEVTISVKLHGTSAIIGNIHVLEPKYKKGWFGKLYTKYFSRLPKWMQKTNQKYDYICSSRSVIINNDINEHDITSGWAGGAVQKEIQRYCELFKQLGVLCPGTTIYGEIVGYYSGTDQAIQKMKNSYDYGCLRGTNKLMIYRIVSRNQHCVYEWNVNEIRDWTIRMMEVYDALKRVLHPIDILYIGKMKDIYPDIPVDVEWGENVLKRMKTDKRWGMEMDEPMCHNIVPREGIVIRKNNDPIKEAFKLKCMKFLCKEAECIDRGEVDLEMEEGYGK